MTTTAKTDLARFRAWSSCCPHVASLMFVIGQRWAAKPLEGRGLAWGHVGVGADPHCRRLVCCAPPPSPLCDEKSHLELIRVGPPKGGAGRGQIGDQGASRGAMPQWGVGRPRGGAGAGWGLSQGQQSRGALPTEKKEAVSPLVPTVHLARELRPGQQGCGVWVCDQERLGKLGRS